MSPEERRLATAVSELADAIRGLALALARDPSPSDRVSVSSWVRVDPTTPVEPGTRVAPGPAPSPQPAPSAPRSHEAIQADFPPLPERCLQACRALASGPSDATPAARASRAWVAGHWARAVLDGVVQKPLPTPALPGLANRVYVVLRLPGATAAAPLKLSSYARYRAVVGQLESGDSISHAFASIAEASVYCEAAGFALPPLQPR